MDCIYKGTNEEEYESVQKNVFGGFVNNTDKTIKIGSIGDIDAGDKNSNGYNMVIFSSST